MNFASRNRSQQAKRCKGRRWSNPNKSHSCEFHLPSMAGADSTCAGSLGESTVPVRVAVRGAYEAWLGEFCRVAHETGMPPAQARERAQRAIIELEGALVLSRVTGDGKPFVRVTQRLPELLTKP